MTTFQYHLMGGARDGEVAYYDGTLLNDHDYEYFRTLSGRPYIDFYLEKGLYNSQLLLELQAELADLYETSLCVKVMGEF